MRSIEDTDLAGLFFHIKKEGRVDQQGQVLRHIRDGYFLCQNFSYADGSRNSYSWLAHLIDMGSWVFYEDADEWREAGDRAYKADSALLEKQLLHGAASPSQ